MAKKKGSSGIAISYGMPAWINSGSDGMSPNSGASGVIGKPDDSTDSGKKQNFQGEKLCFPSWVSEGEHSPYKSVQAETAFTGNNISGPGRHAWGNIFKWGDGSET